MKAQTEERTLEINPGETVEAETHPDFEALMAQPTSGREDLFLGLSNDEEARAWRMAQIAIKGRCVPRGIETVEQAFIAIVHGYSIGVTWTQALQNIAVVNGRPTVWGDLALAIVMRSDGFAGIKETFTDPKYNDAGEMIDLTARCSVLRTRPDGEVVETVGTFSISQAETADLWGKNVWAKYPRRMLQMRARAFALRDGFPDVMKGFGIREEVQDYDAKPTRGRRTAELDVDAAMGTSEPKKPNPSASPAPSMSESGEEYQARRAASAAEDAERVRRARARSAAGERTKPKMDPGSKARPAREPEPERADVTSPEPAGDANEAEPRQTELPDDSDGGDFGAASKREALIQAAEQAGVEKAWEKSSAELKRLIAQA